MSSQHAKKAAPRGSPAVLHTHFYLFSCVCWRPMIEGDFPSKHETKQTCSLSIKTRIPLPAPTGFWTLSHTAYYLHEPDCWGPTEAMKLVKVSVTSNSTRWVAMKSRKCQQIHPDHREPSSSQEWAFGKHVPLLHLKGDAPPHTFRRPNPPSSKSAKCQVSLYQVTRCTDGYVPGKLIGSGFLSFFFYGGNTHITLH